MMIIYAFVSKIAQMLVAKKYIEMSKPIELEGVQTYHRPFQRSLEADPAASYRRIV